MSLPIRTDACSLRLPLPRRAGPPARPRRDPVPQGAHASTSTSPAASTTSPRTCPIASACKTGVATAMVNYPIGELVQAPRPRDGRHAVLQVVRARRRSRAEHRHRLQRSRPRRPRRRSSSTTASNEAGALLKPGDFDWNDDLRRRRAAGSTPAASSRRSRRRRRELIIEGMKAAKAAGRDHFVRPELPRQALDVGRRRQAGRRGAAADRRATSTASIGNEEDLQKGLGIEGPGGREASRVEARPRRRSSA